MVSAEAVRPRLPYRVRASVTQLQRGWHHPYAPGGALSRASSDRQQHCGAYRRHEPPLGVVLPVERSLLIGSHREVHAAPRAEQDDSELRRVASCGTQQ